MDEEAGMKRIYWVALYFLLFVSGVGGFCWGFSVSVKGVVGILSIVICVLSFTSMVVPAPWED